MSRTGFLVAIAVAALMIQFLPQQAGIIKWVVIVLGALYLVIRALRTYPQLYRERRRRAALEAADARDYGLYKQELDAIRAKHEATRELDKISPEHQAE